MSVFPAVYYSAHFRIQGDPGTNAYAIITAYHPLDQRHSPLMNARADWKLKCELVQLALPHVRATGHAPDCSHQEPGWAITCSYDQAKKLARDYRQRAFWWIEQDKLWLVHARAGICESLGSMQRRAIRNISAG